MGHAANIVETLKSPEYVEITVEYLDDETNEVVLKKTYKGTGRFDIEGIIRGVLKDLNSTKDAVLPKKGVLLPPPEVIDTGLIDFRKTLSQLDIIYKLIQMGILDKTDQKVVAFVNKLKNILPIYWDQI
jgi:hypothetical protein